MLPLGSHFISKIVSPTIVRAIHWTSSFDSKKLEEKISQDKEFVHETGKNGNTILHRLAQVEPKNQVETQKVQESVLCLLRNGADPEKPNNQGKTSIDLAADQPAIEQLLLKPPLYFKE